MTTEILQAEYVTRKGRQMVLLPVAEFEDLVRRADLWEPDLPAADADGNRPADEYAAVSQARSILRARRRLGLTQAELARLAGISSETLNRIEHAKNKPSIPTLAKIDRALKQAERK